MANGVADRPKQTQQAPVRPPAPVQAPTASDFLSGLTGKKYIDALVTESEKYLLDHGWSRENGMWREPPAPVSTETTCKITLPDRDPAKKPEVVEQLVLPAAPWIYTLQDAMVRQGYIEGSK